MVLLSIVPTLTKFSLPKSSNWSNLTAATAELLNAFPPAEPETAHLPWRIPHTCKCKIIET